MKAVFASVLLLLLISASLGAEVHAAGIYPLADPHALTSDDGHVSPAACCDAAGHEMSGSCVMLAGLAPDVSSAVPPVPVERAPRPATAPPVAASEPDALRKPPRTL